jgi:DNA-binding winged helix-turn-helix (wHTH) protein
MTMPITTSSALGAPSRELEPIDSPSRYLCFGRFHVDVKREEIFRDGTRVRVPAKVFQVLMALLEKPGDVVTREELRARLWPKGTFVNFDANVNTTVNKLRLVLGGLTDEPQYIETIPRQGYCFVGSVEHRNEPAKANVAPASNAVQDAIHPVADNERATPASVSEAILARMTGFWTSGWAAAVLLCGVLIGMGIVLIAHRPS